MEGYQGLEGVTVTTSILGTTEGNMIYDVRVC